MNPEVAENLLRAVMEEPVDDDFSNHLSVLRSLAMYKYDHYEQYAPGRQFIAYLARWLQQFANIRERQIALQFVRERLIFFSDMEMRHLVNLMARDRVPTVLRQRLAKRLPVRPYRVAQIQGGKEFERAKRASLFLGMSDGARIDQFRRNDRQLSNEQVAMTYEITPQRAGTMVAELRRDVEDDEATFEYIFLMDDFAGSGYTILRNTPAGSLTGKFPRFLEQTLPNLNEEPVPKIFIALYLATEQAVSHLTTTLKHYPSAPWEPCNAPEVITGMTMADNIKLSHGRPGTEFRLDRLFDKLLHRCYDETLNDEHKGPVVHGYSDCGLSLVLPHNTPNNSVYLLWAEQKTRALFPRFERHQSGMGVE